MKPVFLCRDVDGVVVGVLETREAAEESFKISFPSPLHSVEFRIDGSDRRVYSVLAGSNRQVYRGSIIQENVYTQPKPLCL